MSEKLIIKYKGKVVRLGASRLDLQEAIEFLEAELRAKTEEKRRSKKVEVVEK